MVNILQLFLPKIMGMKRVLPTTASSVIDRFLSQRRMSTCQLSNIRQLGESIGLTSDEVTAAVESQIDGVRGNGSSRFQFFAVIVTICVIVVGLVLLVWMVVDPATSPIHTYAPGTDYGTIKPQDFASETPPNP